MKLFLMALLAMSASNTFALETIKVLDGKTAYCKTKYDQFRARLGAYSLNAKAISVDDEKITITTDLKFLKCVYEDSAYNWENSTAMASHEYTIPNADGSLRTIEVVANKAELRAYRDGVYRILSTIDLSDKAVETNIEIMLGDFLTVDEMDRLANGEKLTLGLDAFLIKNVSFLGLDNDLRMNKSFGTFRIRFELEQNNDGSLNAKKL